MSFVVSLEDVFLGEVPEDDDGFGEDEFDFCVCFLIWGRIG